MSLIRQCRRLLRLTAFHNNHWEAKLQDLSVAGGEESSFFFRLRQTY
jgi:hypothetical protein